MNDAALQRAAVLSVLESLIRIDSQNPDLVPGAAGERAIAEFCRDFLATRGVESWTDEVAPGRFNAIGRVTGGDGPVLVLCAHIDTVSVQGMSVPPFEPALHDGRVHGRGSYDMKGGVAAVLSAMAALATDPPAGTVLAALVCDEEYASLGAYDFVRRYPADACILTEPSEGQLILAHKGFVWMEIETSGEAAHGSRWDLGTSAIGRMARIAAALEEFDRSTLRARTHPLVGPASLHCATITGGEGWSTYAARCTMRVERRTLPGEDAAAVLRELQDVIAAAGEIATIEIKLTRSPLECAATSPIAEAVRSAATAVAGSKPADGGVAYWMDAAVFADAGVATVDYGPAGAGAHAADEWVDLDSVIDCARVLEQAARRFLP